MKSIQVNLTFIYVKNYVKNYFHIGTDGLKKKGMQRTVDAFLCVVLKFFGVFIQLYLLDLGCSNIFIDKTDMVWYSLFGPPTR